MRVRVCGLMLYASGVDKVKIKFGLLQAPVCESVSAVRQVRDLFQ